MAAKSNHPLLSNPITSSGRNRANAGLGPLIMFIVMIVVAAVSAGVLINTVGLIEQPGETTPSAQPNQPLQVVTKTGQVSASDPATVQTVVLTVERGPHRDTVSLAGVTVDWFGPTGQTTLQYGAATDPAALSTPATAFAVEPIQDADGSAPHLNAAADRYKLTIDAAAISNGRGLPAGTTVAIKFTTASGATQFITLETPDSLEAQATVSL